MSGIVGIVNLDGRPVDRELLARMTQTLEFRGPDATSVWTDGGVGFGHTLLRTTDEAADEHQPFTFDGSTWIVADVRVDARAELVAKLAARGRHASTARPDVELVLHAYHAWGEDCVEHLLGDFAFAIWDAPRRRLFCARDHMGIRPMFYAHLGSTVIFSNTLDCVREHPAVSTRLNDLAIADFLLFGLNQEKDTTSFTDIQRLAPAHTATWIAGRCKLRRYWTLPIEEPIYFKRLDEYTERFNELLRDAVDDRLRTDRVSIFMSGGLDSTTLAAVAHQRLALRSGATSVKAFTSLLGPDDDERHYAQLAAEHLGIPVHFDDILAQELAPGWENVPLEHVAEPSADPSMIQGDRRSFALMSRHARVAFYGEGPDNALRYEWKAHLRFLMRVRAYGRLLTDVTVHIASHRRVPLLGSLPRMIAVRAQEARLGPPEFPIWINPDLERRLQLRERWAQWRAGTPFVHPVRPRGHHSFDLPLWQSMFEALDPGQTRAAMEVRHPFLGLRLLRFMLQVPALPWCRAKYLLRRAGSDVLPAAVLRRPKTPIAGDPWAQRLRGAGLGPIQSTPAFGAYVQMAPLQTTAQAQDDESTWAHNRALSLLRWLEKLVAGKSESIALDVKEST